MSKPIYRSAKEERARMVADNWAAGQPDEGESPREQAAHKAALAACHLNERARNQARFDVSKERRELEEIMPDLKRQRQTPEGKAELKSHAETSHAANIRNLAEQLELAIENLANLTAHESETTANLEKARETLAAAREAFNTARKEAPEKTDARTSVRHVGGTAPVKVETRADRATCGALCKCAKTGVCEVLSQDQAANGCTRPGFARDSAGGDFFVWGYGTGATFPGVQSRSCVCGKHVSEKADRAPMKTDTKSDARAEMLKHNQSLGRK